MSTKQNDSIFFRNIDREKIEEQSYLVPRIGHSPMISVTCYGHSLDSSVTSYGHSPRLLVTLIARILKKKLKMTQVDKNKFARTRGGEKTIGSWLNKGRIN